MRTYKILITKKNRNELPSGSAIGFSYLLLSETLEDAEAQAIQRLNNSQDASNLFVESVVDVTP